MRDQFEHFYAPDDAAIEAAMKTGLVVPDTNVLLNLYRFQATARDELFEALEKLGDRLWIPHQVGFEFHRNRLVVIADQERFFRETRGELESSVAELRRKISSFRTRLALNKDDLKEIEDGIGALQKLIQGEVTKAEKANEVRLKDRDVDKILARVEKLFDNRVGSPMEPCKLEEARAEAEIRFSKQIPPGYKDAGKERGDPAGDYLIWRQLLAEAAGRKVPVVLVSDDVKDDWVRREQGVPLGARHELREEMTREADVPFVIMTTEIFLRHAEKHLGATVSEETKDQAKELPPARNTIDIFLPADDRWFDQEGSAMSEIPQRVTLIYPVLPLLRSIAAGETEDPAELRFIVQTLRAQLGREETIRRVAQAINDGRASGNLDREGIFNVVTMLGLELSSEPQTVTRFSPALYGGVNPFLPILRDSFERALKVSPERSDPDVVHKARTIIGMQFEKRGATHDDLNRAAEWMKQYSLWLHSRRSESEDELQNAGQVPGLDLSTATTAQLVGWSADRHGPRSARPPECRYRQIN
jgi:hypothetical protein